LGKVVASRADAVDEESGIGDELAIRASGRAAVEAESRAIRTAGERE